MSDEHAGLPNPGSDEAIDAGCVCPVLDNAHGKGYYAGPPGTFVMNEDCLVHGRLRKAQYWLDDYRKRFPNFDILDPDGWDRRAGHWAKSWGEVISEAEFLQRVGASTCQLPQAFIDFYQAFDFNKGGK